MNGFLCGMFKNELNIQLLYINRWLGQIPNTNNNGAKKEGMWNISGDYKIYTVKEWSKYSYLIISFNIPILPYIIKCIHTTLFPSNSERMMCISYYFLSSSTINY